MKLLFIFLLFIFSTQVFSQEYYYQVNTYYEELGGYVIKINSDGSQGIVVAMKDQGRTSWNSWSDIKDFINNPKKHDSWGRKHNDWRLPTKTELNLIYNVYKNGNYPSLSNDYYWSSTESAPSNGPCSGGYERAVSPNCCELGFLWTQFFGNGVQYSDSCKSSDNIVRSVRAYSIYD